MLLKTKKIIICVKTLDSLNHSMLFITIVIWDYQRFHLSRLYSQLAYTATKTYILKCYCYTCIWEKLWIDLSFSSSENSSESENQYQREPQPWSISPTIVLASVWLRLKVSVLGPLMTITGRLLSWRCLNPPSTLPWVAWHSLATRRRTNCFWWFSKTSPAPEVCKISPGMLTNTVPGKPSLRLDSWAFWWILLSHVRVIVGRCDACRITIADIIRGRLFYDILRVWGGGDCKHWS